MLVVSLIGVILIARPPFLFWDSGMDAPEAIDPLIVIRAGGEGSAAERMMAVGHVAIICERIDAHATPVLRWSALHVPQAHVSRKYCTIKTISPKTLLRYLRSCYRQTGACDACPGVLRIVFSSRCGARVRR